MSGEALVRTRLGVAALRVGALVSALSTYHQAAYAQGEAPSAVAIVPEPPKPAYPPCTDKADDAALQAARGAFEAGKAAFNEADYPRAILYWEDAYRRDCSAHLMLKNLARAYEANEQHEHAVVALSTFLERVPTTDERTAIEGDIRRLRGAASGESASNVRAAGHPPRTARHAQRDAQPGRNAAIPAADEPPASVSADEGPSSVAHLAAPLLAVAGAAIAVTGGVLWATASADESAAAKLCPSRRLCPQEVEAAGNDAIDRQRLWSIVGAGGVAMLAGGVVWYLLTPRDSDEVAQSHRVVPQLGAQYVGIDWAASF